MAKFIKLPSELKDLKITAVISESGDLKLYKAVKSDFNGNQIDVKLYVIGISDESYTDDNIAFMRDEAEFLQSVSSMGNRFNYIDVYFDNNDIKQHAELYIVTEQLMSLSELLKTTNFDEKKIVDFGIQMSGILEALESKNIYHGNVSPDNIFVTKDGVYKLGGFSDFESRITDLSFIAPEIYRKEDADLTTDIYSLGLIMYTMCNNDRLPYQANGVSTKEASEKRFELGDFNAPENGSRELKSVIMIACKSENKHRWKNAENISNALLSIKDSIDKNIKIQDMKSDVSAVSVSNENVNGDFEEYEYEDFVDEADEAFAEEKQNTTNADFAETDSINNVAQDSLVDEVIDTTDKADELSETNLQSEDISDEINDATNIKQVASENSEIADDNIFDSFEVKEKNNIKTEFNEKDYGNYFEDEQHKDVTSENVLNPLSDNVEKDFKDENFSVFDTDGSTDDSEYNNDDEYDVLDKKSGNKKNVAIVVICVVIILAALGFIGYCVINGFGNTESTDNTIASTETVEISTTLPATTVIPTTTAEATTVSKNINVTAVVGYGYSYAKELLEADGFDVEIYYYDYSSEYSEGYVISQYPEANESVEKGSVVYLVISLGEEYVEETTAAVTENVKANESSNSSVEKNNTYIFANSNSAYLSESEVKALSREQLNIALNEIYARHGRIFTNSTLSEYFNSQSWYTPQYSPSEFDAKVEFNEYEQANLQLMIKVQEEKGYR